jgi:hypothetical protein
MLCSAKLCVRVLATRLFQMCDAEIDEPRQARSIKSMMHQSTCGKAQVLVVVVAYENAGDASDTRQASLARQFIERFGVPDHGLTEYESPHT